MRSFNATAGTGIGVEGAKAIGEGLKHNSSLQTLDLGGECARSRSNCVLCILPHRGSGHKTVCHTHLAARRNERSDRTLSVCDLCNDLMRLQVTVSMISRVRTSCCSGS